MSTCVVKAGGPPSVSIFAIYYVIYPFNVDHLPTRTVNAASKGHLPVVLYLLTKQQADPLVRNNWGETACDVAAAVFEVWICEAR